MKKNDRYYPLRFLSRVLTKLELAYENREREIRAGVYCMQSLHVYLEHRVSFLESTRPEVNETAIKISNFGRYPQFRRPSNFGPPSGAILTPTCARAWEARAGCVSMPPGGLWRGEWTQLARPMRIFVLCFVLRM